MGMIGHRPSKTKDDAQAAAGRGRRFLKATGGATAVEFALIAPVLIAALAGILAYGIYFGAANSVQQLAADAARASVGGLSDAERAALATARVNEEAGRYVLLDPSKVSVTATPAIENANLFQVRVSYDASKLGPFAFEGLIPLPAKTIVRTSTIQRGGY